ncbi:MAG: hypothetical protein ACLTDR_02335 [Adlercreutzia equolifaciens]
MAPDKMVGLAQELNVDDQLRIFGEKFADYPVFGAVLGAKDDLNREAGCRRTPGHRHRVKGAKEDLDALQEQLASRLSLIEAKLSDHAGAACMSACELLGMEETRQRAVNLLHRRLQQDRHHHGEHPRGRARAHGLPAG